MKRNYAVEECLGCKFFHKMEDSIRVGTCRRYPKEERKQGDNWCGDFKTEHIGFKMPEDVVVGVDMGKGDDKTVETHFNKEGEITAVVVKPGPEEDEADIKTEAGNVEDRINLETGEHVAFESTYKGIPIFSKDGVSALFPGQLYSDFERVVEKGDVYITYDCIGKDGLDMPRKIVIVKGEKDFMEATKFFLSVYSGDYDPEIIDVKVWNGKEKEEGDEKN